MKDLITSLSCQMFAEQASHSTSTASLGCLDHLCIPPAFHKDDNLPCMLRFDLRICVSYASRLCQGGTSSVPAIEGSNAATIVVEVPCPRVFQVIFSFEVFPDSSM